MREKARGRREEGGRESVGEVEWEMEGGRERCQEEGEGKKRGREGKRWMEEKERKDSGRGKGDSGREEGEGREKKEAGKRGNRKKDEEKVLKGDGEKKNRWRSGTDVTKGR